MINDRYNIKKILGTGSSQVYLCTDLNNPSKDVAIKILPTDTNQKELETFRNEYFLLKKMNHSNIVRVYEYGTILRIEKGEMHGTEITEGSKYFTVDYIEGETLDKYDCKDDLNNLKVIIEQICSVLYYLHQSNYIYYNLNMENILIQFKHNFPHVYLYDFSLAKFIPNNELYEVQGTPHYIAPEILQINQVDHRADLYSLGIIFYHLIYNRFPFDTTDELNIYKANIEKVFDFPDKSNYEKLIDITKNLLHKSPTDRYNNSLQILEELQIPISNQMKNNWKPIKHFCGRKKEIYDINSIIYSKNAKEIVAIRGENGSGKSFFLEEINYNQINSIGIKISDVSPNNRIWNVLLRNIFYSDLIYQNIDDTIKNEIRNLLINDSNELTEKLKSFFLRISRENNFILLLDDFNSYDKLSIEILREIIPILQVNGIKIILTENTDKPIISDFIHDLVVFHLNPFTEEDLNEFIEMSYFKPFPKLLLKNIIAHNSDLLPGNISYLIDNLISLDFLQFDYRNVKIRDRGKNIDFNKLSHNEIYRLKIDELSNDEFNIINLYALFDIHLDIKILSTLSGFNQEKTENIIVSLIKKGIFYNDNIGLNPLFSSGGLRNYVYDKIALKKEKHLFIAEKILELIPDFNNIECARHFIIAGEYKKCYKIFKNELYSPAAKSNMTYQKNILSELVAFPLDNDDLLEIKYSLSRVLFELKEVSECINLINELLKETLNNDQETELLIQKGICLIKLEEYNEGICLLNSILSCIKNGNTKQRVNIEIAQAYLELKNYSAAANICRNVISEKQNNDENIANAYRIIAFIDQEEKNNLSGAIYNLQYAINIYQRANLSNYVVLMELTIGDIIYMKGNMIEAEKHWQTSFKINERIGNLSNEANILLKYGLYYFNNQDYGKAIEQYQRAENIFSSLGNIPGRGFTLLKIGEIYLNICEYDLALKNLELAKNILDNYDKEKNAEVIFLLGQFYFYMSDTENLTNIVNLYEKSFPQNDFVDKYKNNLAYLKILLSFCQEKYSDVIQEIDAVIKYYKNYTDQESFLYFAKSNILLIKSLINQKNYNPAKTLLSEASFLKMCDSNLMLRAEREYLLGLISEKNGETKLKPENEYYTKALKLIENQVILELTWEINYALAIFYFERGNYKKFSEYSLVTKSLINFISSKISSKLLRKKYLNSFSRKSIIKTLEINEKLI